MSGETDPTIEDDEYAFYEALWNDPPERLIMPAESAVDGIDFDFSQAAGRECRIWEGYLDASQILLDRILKPRSSFYRHLIFPAMFTLRHGLEVSLKWHIRYAGGTVPKDAGHNLDVLIEAFRQTAEGLDDDATYIAEDGLDLISELADIDPRSIAF